MKRFFIITVILIWNINSTMVAGEASESTFDQSEDNWPGDDDQRSKEEMMHAHDRFFDHFPAHQTPVQFEEHFDTPNINRKLVPHEEAQILFEAPKKFEDPTRQPEIIDREINLIPNDEFVIIKHPDNTSDKQSPSNQFSQDDLKHWKLLGKLLGKILAKLITLQLDHAILKKSVKATHGNKKQISIHLKRFKQLMRKLTTKEKEDVANIWLKERQDQYDASVNKLQTTLKEIKASPNLNFHTKNKLVHETNHLIKNQKTRFNQERALFHDDMQSTLNRHEILVYNHRKNLWSIKPLHTVHTP